MKGRKLTQLKWGGLLLANILALADGKAQTSPTRYILAVSDRETLQTLEHSGLALSSQLGKALAPNRVANFRLIESTIYRQVTRIIAQDLRDFEADIKPAPPALGPDLFAFRVNLPPVPL